MFEIGVVCSKLIMQVLKKIYVEDIQKLQNMNTKCSLKNS